MLIDLPAAPPLELRGADALAFAQAQFASDVAALGVGRWQWSAWLSAQGRVRALFALLRPAEDTLLLVLRGSDPERLREELSRYVFRSRVALGVRADLPVRGATQAADLAAAFPAIPEGAGLQQRGAALAFALPGARWLVLGADNAAPNDAAALAAWRLADVRDGLPTLPPALGGELLPQWLGLDRLGAISVQKGCYPGQEVMARLHFKGGVKRGLARVAFAADTLPAAGTALLAEAAEAGLLLDCAWAEPGQAEALAVLALDAPATLQLGDASGPSIQVVSRFR